MYQSVAAALENMSLTAYEKGLGSCWLTSANAAGLGDELREKFAPGKGDYVAMMTIGYPKITPRAPARKEGRFDII
jgi:nitroreductase